MARKFKGKGTANLLAALTRVSLKGRLAILLCAVMAIAVVFSGMLVLQQHRIAEQGADAAIVAHEQMVRVGLMRETLGDIDRGLRNKEVPTGAISRFRTVLEDERRTLRDPESIKLIEGVRTRFDSYIVQAQSAEPSVDFEDVDAQVSALFQYDQQAVSRNAERLRLERERSIRTAVLFLLAFAIVLYIGGYKLIEIITQPLSSLASFLDSVDLEDGMEIAVPPIVTPLPEVSRLATSFERLVERLRGYRALNVRRLLSEKQRADILAASMSDGLILLRGDQVVYANPVGERMLGMTPSRRRYRISHRAREGSGSGAHAVWLAVQQTIPVEFSLQVEGRTFHYLIQSSQIPYDLIEQAEEGFRANTLIVAQDVTLVKESQDAKSHFLATLSHEIKTPVTSLVMATRLLKRALADFPNPSHRQLIQTCADDVDRLRTLLEDLLSVSRLDTLGQQLSVQNVDIARLVRHAVQSFQVNAHERSIELHWQIASDVKRLIIPMDPAKISWALSNLLTNALRHTPRGGKVSVQIENDTNQNAVKIGVRDTGPGIERKRLDRIFDKFNPFYDLRVARSGSVGAGLAIAREIVAAHGGRIWAASEPGQGAEFFFTLPTRQTHGEGVQSGTSTRSG